MLMLPGVLNGRKTAFSLFLREIRLRPTITYAISAPKLYNSATKLSSPERASATDTEENAIIEMNGVLRFLCSLPNSLVFSHHRFIRSLSLTISLTLHLQPTDTPSMPNLWRCPDKA